MPTSVAGKCIDQIGQREIHDFQTKQNIFRFCFQFRRTNNGVEG